MARGEAIKTRVHLKGNHQDFIVFVDDADTYKKWKTDRSIPLAHFISSFKIFGTGGQGTQGIYDAPSKGDLENQFDTTDEDAIIKKILEEGEAQEMEMPERQGNTNDSYNSTKTRWSDGFTVVESDLIKSEPELNRRFLPNIYRRVMPQLLISDHNQPGRDRSREEKPGHRGASLTATMVPLPLFKLAALFVRHISKYGANQIKAAAHDHPRFRAFAARHGQSIHQLNMRLSVALLRNVDAEMRAKELAEAPTVKTKEQVEKEEASKKEGSSSGSGSSGSKSRPKWQSVWKRKFRQLPEAKAVSLFADVVGDAFILGVAGGLLIFEYWRASQKPDQNLERIKALTDKIEEMKLREEELVELEEKQRVRMDRLEEALRVLRDPKTKKPLLPSLQPSDPQPTG
ncbi:hypothetical protein jhhlp_007150 [Lomentospora prolificans]|uniref:Ribosome maturation protein SDO1/SBDS N-terminal domain-containing protein n=1 Tax=Lomentospora prolificans TaxID=41688 RepID=A0A2N3N1X2_9PEZI|nr:hypothetical protein jhhlp_007150 [Lomentospora prolificans]